MGCLANTKGILVTSSKSVTVLGLIVGAAGPPEGYKLLEIEASNHQSCDFLLSFGFDGR